MFVQEDTPIGYPILSGQSWTWLIDWLLIDCYFVLRQNFGEQIFLTWTSLCRLDWPATHPPAIAFRILGLKVCNTILTLTSSILNHKIQRFHFVSYNTSSQSLKVNKEDIAVAFIKFFSNDRGCSYRKKKNQLILKGHFPSLLAHSLLFLNYLQ